MTARPTRDVLDRRSFVRISSVVFRSSICLVPDAAANSTCLDLTGRCLFPQFALHLHPSVTSSSVCRSVCLSTLVKLSRARQSVKSLVTNSHPYWPSLRCRLFCSIPIGIHLHVKSSIYSVVDPCF